MPLTSSSRLQFGDGFELDLGAYELRRKGRAVKLPRIPMEVLLLIVERRGNLVAREEIIQRIWGSEIFVDTDNSINTAIRKIRQALRDDPAEPRFVQTVTGRGYRFIAAVTEMDLAPPGAFAVSPSFSTTEAIPAPAPAEIHSAATVPPEPPFRGRFLSWRFWAALTCASVLLLIALELYRPWSRTRTSSRPAGARIMLAVLPFENLTGDPAEEYFSDGMTEEMITDLGELDPRHFGVIARTSVMLYKHNPKPVDQIGRELGVQYLIEGSVRRDSKAVRITAQLIQVKDQTHLWARQYDRELKDLLALQAEIAQEATEQVRLVAGNQPPLEPVRPAVTLAKNGSYESYDLYLKGRYYWNRRRAGFEQAATYFQQAIAKDPNNARAYAGLADTFALMSTYLLAPEAEYIAKARVAALQALRLDDSLAEAHASFGLIVESSEYDWDTAEREFRRAIQLNPDYATAHQWYAEHLAWRGRFDQAFAESEQARQLDPLSVIIAADHCKILYFARQYDRAIAHCRTVLQMDPRANGAQFFIVGSLVEQGRFEEAAQQITAEPNPGDLTFAQAKKAYVYGRWGRTAEARRAIAEVERHRKDMVNASISGLLLAYSGAGTNDQLMALLQKAYAEHSSILGSLKVDPMYDRLRGDSRFRELLHRVGLDQ